ncbi:uncharacterized protein LOC130948450 isoform X1 [Arachis stenosperma]|uniref:uncharacterized protein LOC130948450 isoform X1 n=1 Tax=Arachis stenosperma TaxID=217475 RepID=UPI0025AC3CD5|nr:uncharacterized protein LOC130948450 isoform X1 [Arachis stenosperma]
MREPKRGKRRQSPGLRLTPMVYMPSISYNRYIVPGHRSSQAASYLPRTKGRWRGTSVVRPSAMHVSVSSRGFPASPVSSSSTFPCTLLCAARTHPLLASRHAMRILFLLTLILRLGRNSSLLKESLYDFGTVYLERMFKRLQKKQGR